MMTIVIAETETMVRTTSMTLCHVLSPLFCVSGRLLMSASPSSGGNSPSSSISPISPTSPLRYSSYDVSREKRLLCPFSFLSLFRRDCVMRDHWVSSSELRGICSLTGPMSMVSLSRSLGSFRANQSNCPDWIVIIQNERLS